MWEFQETMLTAEDLVRRRTKSDFSLPTKGPKCFTPSGSWLETKQLQTLLDATKTLIGEERVERENALAQAEWDEDLKVAIVTRVVGRQFEKFGHDKNTSIFLYPEEALHLLETNHLQLLYGGVSMSIQQAYTVLLGPKTGCSFIEYLVFSHLLKNGFKVLRHSPKRTVTRYERAIGLYVEPPKNRKSRRKCSVPEKENSCESNNKKIKTDQRIVNKNEKQGSLEYNNVDLRLLPSDSKQAKPADKVVGMSFEAITDNHSSVGSDIEILSEKNACRSEESVYYTEYSSLASDDSDCQVIEEIDMEANVPKADIKRFYGNKVIEEINLSDSEGSDVESRNLEFRGFVKNEIDSEIKLCDITELKESTSLQDEQSNTNATHDSENHMNNVIEPQSSVVESSISETNDCNDSVVVEQMNSSELMESVCVTQEILVEKTIEQNDTSVISTDGQEKQSVELEDCKGMSDSICVLNDIKEEGYSPLSVPLLRESVIQRNAAVKCKKEINSTVVLGTQTKEEEIEVIELDDENSESSKFEDKKTILSSFPNVAGCHIVRCDVPPEKLCPPNVCPSQQSYNIDLDRLQDPKYGGNPKKKRNVPDGRFHYQYARHENASQDKIFRYNTSPNRQYNRYSNDNSFNNNPDGRNERWHDVPNQSRNEGFVDHSEFSQFREQPPYPDFQQSPMDQSTQNYYPQFSGHPMRNLSPFLHSRANFRPRGNPNREMYRQNSPFRNCRFRNSHSRRFSRRRSRGGRNAHGGRYFGSRERADNESYDATDGNYVPCNMDNTHSSYEQPRRTQQSGLAEKRHRTLYDENINTPNSREKRPRRVRGNYFPPTRNSHDLLQFLDVIHPDSNTGNTVANTGLNLSTSNCDSNPNDFLETGGKASAFAETESTDNTSSAGRSSCSDSCSSEGSSEESAYENVAERDSISVLLKSDDLEDIDTCLKSLEIVHTVKFRGFAAECGELLLSIKFDLYQPSTYFRRSNPPVPDFRVVIMQPDQNLPTSRQLAFLGEGFDDDVPLLFAIASTDSVAFYLQSVLDLPTVSSKEKVQG